MENPFPDGLNDVVKREQEEAYTGEPIEPSESVAMDLIYLEDKITEKPPDTTSRSKEKHLTKKKAQPVGIEGRDLYCKVSEILDCSLLARPYQQQELIKGD